MYSPYSYSPCSWADVGQLAFKAEDVGQNVFQFINHVVVGCLSVVVGPLQLQGLAQVSQGEDVFGYGDKDQLSDLLAAVELLLGEAIKSCLT